MIQEFVTRWEAGKNNLREKYSTKRPDSYDEIVEDVIGLLHDDEQDGSIDPERITAIDHGGYRGTRVFVIASSGYEPSDYWYLRMEYGSCSGCDWLESIYGWGGEITKNEVSGYMALALHIVQRLKKMDDYSTEDKP